VTADLSEAAEGDTVTLTVTAAEGFRLKQLRVVNSVFYTLEKMLSVEAVEGEEGYKVKFAMPHDNVTLVPVFEDATAAYKLDFTGVDNGTVPPGWRCVQENDEVHQYPNTYSQGARTFSGFSGHQGKALYWREKCAEYGRQSGYPLTLEAGSYKLTYAMAAWKGSPKYKVQVLGATDDTAVATSQTYTASPNANGNTGASVSTAVNRELKFEVSKPGKYVVSFTNESNTANNFDEYLLLECRINFVSPPAGIIDLMADGEEPGIELVYDLNGRRVDSRTIGRGIRIVRTADGKTRKVVSKP
jgi:hypothetical protein